MHTHLICFHLHNKTLELHCGPSMVGQGSGPTGQKQKQTELVV